MVFVLEYDAGQAGNVLRPGRPVPRLLEEIDGAEEQADQDELFLLKIPTEQLMKITSLQVIISHWNGRWLFILGVFITTFAVWTVYCHVLVIIAANFALLLKMAWIPWAISILLISVLPRLRFFKLASPSPTHNKKPIHISTSLWLVAPVFIVAIYAAGISYILFWVLSVCYMIGVVLFGVPLALKQGSGSVYLSSGRQNAVLGVLIFCAVLITLVSHRPDADDAFYLNLAISAVENPFLPLLSFDGMYGEPDLPLLAYFYRVNSFELLIAVVSSVTQLSVYTVYYLLVPAIMAVLVIVAYWLALRELSGQGPALIGVAVVLLVLVAWGDVHRSYGNFSFVRLFQGKGILVSICIPAIIYYTVRYVRFRDAHNWCCLVLVQIAAIGFTSSALVVAPVATAFVLIGSWRLNREDTKMLALGLMSSLYLVCTAIILAQGMDQEMGNISRIAGTAKQSFLIEKGLGTVLGEGGRAYFALYALLAAPTFVISARYHKMLSGTVLATVVLVLNPLTVVVINKLIPNMYWRILWGIPFPLWIGLTCGGMAMYGGTLRSWQRAVARSAVLVGMFILFPGAWTVSPENRTWLGIPGYKVSPLYDTAREIVELTPQEGSVLAPWNVSRLIPLFKHHPPVVVVRPDYLSIIAVVYGKDEVKTRRQMARFVSGAKLTEKQVEQILRIIEFRELATVVLPKRHPFGTQVGNRLKKMGYSLHPSQGYDIWLRNG